MKERKKENLEKRRRPNRLIEKIRKTDIERLNEIDLQAEKVRIQLINEKYKQEKRLNQ